MNLGCNETNELFSINDDKTKYVLGEFDAMHTIGTNNLMMFINNIPNGANVLDVGSGDGHYGKYLFDKGCTVFGMEVDKESAQMAIDSGFYKHFFTMDVTDEKYDCVFKELENRFDVIIFSDILEHLIDPTKILLKFSKTLKENGIILISLPNIAHMDIIINLLNGKFNYSKIGILDNTHLKFFTKSSFLQWILKINQYDIENTFECNFLGATFYNTKTMESIEKNYPELFNLLSLAENSNGLQLLFKLTKLKKGEKTPELDNLLNQKDTDVCLLLGQALQSALPKNITPKLVEGERLWLKQALSEKDEIMRNQDLTIKNLENMQITLHNLFIEQQKYINELELKEKENLEILTKQKQYINELELKQKENIEIFTKQKKYINELELKQKENLEIFTKQKKYINELELKQKKNLEIFTKQKQYINELELKQKENLEIYTKQKQYINELELKQKENLEIFTKQKQYINELEENLTNNLGIYNKSQDYIIELEKNLRESSENYDKSQAYISQLYENLTNNTEILHKSQVYINELEENLKNNSKWFRDTEEYYKKTLNDVIAENESLKQELNRIKTQKWKIK